MAKKNVNTAVAEKEEEKKVDIQETEAEEILEGNVEEAELEEDEDDEVDEKPKKKKAKKQKKLTKEKVVGGIKTVGKYALAAGAGAVATIGVIVMATKPKKEEVEMLEKFDDWQACNNESETESDSDVETTEF